MGKVRWLDVAMLNFRGVLPCCLLVMKLLEQCVYVKADSYE